MVRENITTGNAVRARERFPVKQAHQGQAPSYPYRAIGVPRRASTMLPSLIKAAWSIEVAWIAALALCLWKSPSPARGVNTSTVRSTFMASGVLVLERPNANGLCSLNPQRAYRHTHHRRLRPRTINSLIDYYP